MSKSSSARRVVAMCVTLVAALAVIQSAGAHVSATKAAASADFKMMIISGFGGVASNANPEILKGAQAAADRINKQGGLGGRKITLEGCSTQNSTSGDAACARKAVDQGFENVIWRSSFAAGSYKITQAAGIPSIGTIATLTGDYTPKLSFPVIETSQNDFVGAMALAAKDPRNKVWAALGVQNSGSALTVNQTRTLAKKYGRKYAGGILSPVLPVPDYQPIVQKLKGMNPDVVVCSCPVPHHVAWHGAMVQLGWRPRVIVSNTGTVTDAVVAQFADQGKIPMISGGGTPDASAPNAKNKLITAFRKDIAASGLSRDSVNYSSSSMAGWIAVDALGKLSKKIKGTVNKATLIAAARKVKKTNSIDMYGVFKWAPGSPGPAAVPRFRAGTSYAHTWDANAKRWVFKQAFDSWKILGYKLP